MSDPYVVIFPNAKKLEVDTRMMSKHIQGTVTPVVRSNPPFCTLSIDSNHFLYSGTQNSSSVSKTRHLVLPSKFSTGTAFHPTNPWVK